MTKTGAAEDGGNIQDEWEEAPDRPVPSGELRAVARLGERWTTRRRGLEYPAENSR